MFACSLRTSSLRSFFVFEVGTIRARFDFGMLGVDLVEDKGAGEERNNLYAQACRCSGKLAAWGKGVSTFDTQLQ